MAYGMAVPSADVYFPENIVGHLIGGETLCTVVKKRSAKDGSLVCMDSVARFTAATPKGAAASTQEIFRSSSVRLPLAAHNLNSYQPLPALPLSVNFL